MDPTAVTVVVADDDESIRLWLRSLIQLSADLRLVGEADNAAAAVELARTEQPDVAVIDVRMPGGGGVEGAQLIRMLSPDTRVLAFSAYDMAGDVLAMIEAGANGYVVKSGDDYQIIAAIRAVAAGAVYLSPGVDTTVVAHLRETLVATGQQVAQHARTLNVIDDVLVRRAVTAHYQPILDLATDAIVGYEALARIDSERRLPTSQWFDEAGAVGRLSDLEQLAIAAALPALDDLPSETFLAINLSPQSAIGPLLTETLEDMPVDRLVLEITEHAAVADYTRLLHALYPLRARGLRLAVDDVGAGYSSMAHVVNLSPEIIKLDRAFTARIDQQPQRQSLVDSMRVFAADTGAVLLAEGIETVEELETMRALGVALGQGYLLGRPAALIGDGQSVGTR
ncbi:MAG: EAL domain-containing protein [Acidimicrobiales bacterium]